MKFLNLTPKQKTWLTQGEKFVFGLVAAAGYEYVKQYGLPHDKATLQKLGVALLGVGYTAVRLWLKQSPLPVDPPPAQQ